MSHAPIRWPDFFSGGARNGSSEWRSRKRNIVGCFLFLTHYSTAKSPFFQLNRHEVLKSKKCCYFPLLGRHCHLSLTVMRPPPRAEFGSWPQSAVDFTRGDIVFSGTEKNLHLIPSRGYEVSLLPYYPFSAKLLNKGEGRKQPDFFSIWINDDKWNGKTQLFPPDPLSHYKCRLASRKYPFSLSNSSSSSFFSFLISFLG